MSRALEGHGVLVTRPRGRADGLCRVLEAMGARVVELPTVEIQPLRGPALERRARQRLASAEWLIFTSPAAVEQGWALFEAASRTPSPDARIAAVGRGTAGALERIGRRVDLSPRRGGGGEALLAAPGSDALAGRRVLVVRGEDGREGLAQGLRARGAEVDFLDVYRRVLPRVDPASAAAGWRDGSLGFTIVTSVTGLDHLLQLVDGGDRERLRGTQLVTVSERIAAAGKAAGFRAAVTVAVDPSDEAVAAAVCQAAAQAD